MHYLLASQKCIRIVHLGLERFIVRICFILNIDKCKKNHKSAGLPRWRGLVVRQCKWWRWGWRSKSRRSSGGIHLYTPGFLHKYLPQVSSLYSLVFTIQEKQENSWYTFFINICYFLTVCPFSFSDLIFAGRRCRVGAWDGGRSRPFSCDQRRQQCGEINRGHGQQITPLCEFHSK